MKKRIFIFLITFFAGFGLLSIACKTNDFNEKDNNKNGNGNNMATGKNLKDIAVFYANNNTSGDINYNQWTNNISVTTDDNYDGKKVYKFSVTNSSAAEMQFPVHNWMAFSLEQYYENGYFEFYVRGAQGGEEIKMGLKSKAQGAEKEISVTLQSQGNAVTTTWQKITLPIKNIVKNAPSGFDIKNITVVRLTIQGSKTIYMSEWYIKTPDGEFQFPVIKVNQVGYELNQPKYALVSCYPGTLSLSNNTNFTVYNSSNQEKFTGKLTTVSSTEDSYSGEVIYKADFSNLNEPGKYYIKITEPAVADSYEFTIGNDIYKDLFVDAIKYFYFQRQGIELTSQYAGKFTRPLNYKNDSSVKMLSAKNGTGYDVSQGWYDAGDFGKYFPPAASTVTDLLFAYEFFPALFSDSTNIPESGNGAPDILDEIKWELDMMLKFEDGNTGAFWEAANYDGNTIYIIDTHGSGGAANTRSTHSTAWVAGVFAHAYIIYKDIPSYQAYANTLLAAAERAWTYIENNPSQRNWVSGAGRSYDYSQIALNKVKLLAAAALYRATGTAKYNTYVANNYQTSNFYVSSGDDKAAFDPSQTLSIGNVGTAFLHYAKSSNQRGYNSAVTNFFSSKFTSFENGIKNYYNGAKWPLSIPDWAFWWGSNSPLVRTPVELYMCNNVLNKSTTNSVELMREAMNYLLGINPLSFSFISGYGENCVKNIFSGIYSNDGIKDIPRGYMAGGANRYDAGFFSNYPAKCYIDSDEEYTVNEHAIYWNAALVLCLTATVGTR